MPKNRGPKSNANRRNRATRRTDRLAHVPSHTMITYDASPAALSIDLDFCTDRPVAEEEEIFHELVNTVPQYSDETNIIHLRMIFGSVLNDTEGVSRRGVLAHVVEIINGFPHIKEITFSIDINHYDWKQVSSASAIYGLKFPNWTFNMKVENREAQQILFNSRIDRQLRAAEAKALQQTL
ncbi:uncharacterized protein EAF01_004966 [Botrytis porri]|uniref:Uncharacterized protein n=1 Tax=Botrytis porri TaxID=87229 RepID=A0A4Z1L1U5_9HELO|nr:uncharacterized protein EAF01_004966 [Botrytis porri]KAF7907379.1 hypothetical protein EAF01_004966 [Botrytis porri]TGO90789.1 hypothetical protein BPOR_0051g00240 [Botrytis porri]